MKRNIIALILVIIIAIMPITVNADDDLVSDPVGETFLPSVSADSLEDFTKKLNELKADDLQLYYINTIQIDDIYTKVLEAIVFGENYVYLPGVDCEITKIDTYVVSDHGEIFPAYSSRYSYYISQDCKIALTTVCSFRYDNTDCRINYGVPNHTFIDKVIPVHGKAIPCDISQFGNSNNNWTNLYFKYGGVDFELHIGKALTEEEIKALPEEMFTPKIIGLDTLAAFTVDTDVIAVDDPIEPSICVCEGD